GMFVPDPFIYLRVRGRAVIVMSDLEINRARHEATHCRVLSLSRIQRQLRSKGAKTAGYAHVIHYLFRSCGIKKAVVPHNFPFGLASDLRKLRVKLKASTQGSLFPERQVKS